jgi:hypothetical protein
MVYLVMGKLSLLVCCSYKPNITILPMFITIFITKAYAYYEVLSYTKLLNYANKRNQILFDKLFSPTLSEITRFTEVNRNHKIISISG